MAPLAYSLGRSAGLLQVEVLAVKSITSLSV